MTFLNFLLYFLVFVGSIDVLIAFHRFKRSFTVAYQQAKVARLGFDESYEYTLALVERTKRKLDRRRRLASFFRLRKLAGRYASRIVLADQLGAAVEMDKANRLLVMSVAHETAKNPPSVINLSTATVH